MTRFNYTWHRKRTRRKVVEKLPPGLWMRLSDATVYTGYSDSTLRKHAMLGKIESVIYHKVLHVKVK